MSPGLEEFSFGMWFTFGAITAVLIFVIPAFIAFHFWVKGMAEHTRKGLRSPQR